MDHGQWQPAKLWIEAFRTSEYCLSHSASSPSSGQEKHNDLESGEGTTVICLWSRMWLSWGCTGSTRLYLDTNNMNSFWTSTLCQSDLAIGNLHPFISMLHISDFDALCLYHGKGTLKIVLWFHVRSLYSLLVPSSMDGHGSKDIIWVS